MAKNRLEPNAFKAEEIAAYLRGLIDTTQELDKRLQTLERAQEQVFSFPSLPFGGDNPSLETNQTIVVRVTSIDVDAGRFWGRRLENSGSVLTDHSELTSPVFIRVLSGGSCPDLNDNVLAHFVGEVDGSSSSGYRWVSGQSDAILLGKTTSRSFSYPTDPNSNVYEVQTYTVRFSDSVGPGKQTFTLFTGNVVLAGCWEGNCTLLPQGTFVILNRSRSRWFFQKTNLVSLTVVTSIRVNTTDLLIEAYTRDVIVCATSTPTSSSWKSWTTLRSC